MTQSSILDILVVFFLIIHPFWGSPTTMETSISSFLVGGSGPALTRAGNVVSANGTTILRWFRVAAQRFVGVGSGWDGWGGGGMLNVNVSCQLATHADATSRLGLGHGWGGDVNVHVNLRHTRMLRHVLGWVGWVGGDVNVHVNLRHTRMLRHVLGGWGGVGGS